MPMRAHLAAHWVALTEPSLCLARQDGDFIGQPLLCGIKSCLFIVGQVTSVLLVND